jgi:demethylmenaquinone methyltransferase/2-methoxy-6-polyprenyl-1,4-benzoquinol methylase
MPIIEHFDLVAPLYDRLSQPTGEPVIQQHLRLPCRGYLLDAGGGTGRIAASLAGDFQRRVVLDVSLPMLERTVTKDCCRAVAGSTEHPPFTEGTFDRIIMVDAFHHLADQSASLRQCWRLLAPGGRLVIEEPDIATWGVRLVALAEKLLLMRSHFWSGEQIAAEFSQAAASVKISRQGHTFWVIVDKEN